MMEGADLEIPRIPDEGELEEALEEVRREHLLRQDDLGMTGELRSDPVFRELVHSMADALEIIPRIPPSEGLKSVPDAGSPGLGDVDEEEVVLDG
jgi:hypothetical protein